MIGAFQVDKGSLTAHRERPDDRRKVASDGLLSLIFRSDPHSTCFAVAEGQLPAYVWHVFPSVKIARREVPAPNVARDLRRILHICKRRSRLARRQQHISERDHLGGI